MKDKYSIHNPDVKVKYLIYHHHDPDDGEMQVYIDEELDLEWECDEKAGKIINTPPLKMAVRKIVNEVAALENIPQNWPPDLKLTSKRMLGEALASILRDDSEGAAAALENARKFVRGKSKQVSRYWTLQGCFTAGGIAVMAGVIQILARRCFIKHLGQTPFLLALCFWAGCVGALLFVVLRLGTQPRVDSTAEKQLHYLESAARIVGGGIAGILVGAMVKLGLILPVLGQTGMEALAMCTAAMIAGASERLAAGIITKIENNETTKEESENAYQ